MRSLIPSVVAAILGYFAARLIIPSAAPPNLEPPVAKASVAPSAQTSQASTQSAEPSASKPPPTFKEMKAAVNGKDIFVAATKWQAWLDSATTEDLEQFVRDPKSLPEPHTSDYYHQFRDAFYAALVERWFAVNENALPSIRKLHDALKVAEAQEASRMMKAATKARPELFLTDLTAERTSLSSDESSALQSLAARDVRKARELASSLSDKARKSAEIAIIHGIAESDPLSALALSRSLDRNDAQSVQAAIIAAAERIGPGVLKQVFADANGAFDGSYIAPELLMRYPDIAAYLKPDEANTKMGSSPHPPYNLFREADLMSPEDRARRVEQIAAMPEGVRDSTAAALAASWARDEPLKAAEWAMKLAKPDAPENTANQAAHFAFLRWIHVDRAAALAWLRSQPESPLRNSIGTNAASFVAEAGDLDAAVELCHPSTSKVDQSATAHLVQIYVERDPDAAAAWLATVPNAINNATASKLFSSWYPNDPMAVGRWVENLPAGKGRDEALNALVQKLSWESPSVAAEWTETIADSNLRQQAAGFTFQSMRRDDPERAREWLLNLRGVEPQWKERMARQLR